MTYKDNKKILIIGSDGQLGYDLMRVFGKQAVGLTHKDIEIADFEHTRKVVKENNPDVVINTAAIVKLESCETEPRACFTVNAVGAYHVAKATAEVGAVIISISTDYVFDGSKKEFLEEDVVNPLNVYGASKAAGENLVKIANNKYYIIRSSSFFGFKIPHKGLDFPRRILDLASKEEPVEVVDDQISSPTYTKDLAAQIKELIDREAPYGIYHITNSGIASWYQFAKEVFEIKKVKAKLISTKSDFNVKAKRPLNSVLINSKLKTAGVSPLRNWKDALREYFEELK